MPRDLPIDVPWMRDVMLDLLRIPSPTGRTDEVMQRVGELLEELGLQPYLTRRGAMRAALPGPTGGAQRAVTVHTDTIGAMVRGVTERGRLLLTPVGTWSARFAEGARVTVFRDEPPGVTGTILPRLASGHAYGDEVDTQGVGWDHVELRLDALVQSPEDVERIGVHVGDHVAIMALPEVTPSGFVRSRHLDDKAGVAAVLAAVKALRDAGVEVQVPTSLLVTITEEVGHGASSGLTADTSEMVSVDAAVVAPGQTSTETGVTVLFQDMSGPFDYHLARKLVHLGQRHGVEVNRDVFRFYRSDAAAALEAGFETRVALLGFGVDATHGHERTHLRSLEATARLVALYLQEPLTHGAWDERAGGELIDFPSHSVQPIEREPRVTPDDQAPA